MTQTHSKMLTTRRIKHRAAKALARKAKRVKKAAKTGTKAGAAKQ
jgi:hypothetical protein